MSCPVIAKFKKLAQTWGGDVIQHTEKSFAKATRGPSGRVRAGFYDAPFSHRDLGVFHRRGHLLYVEEDDNAWTELVHEMGHIFASLKNPENSNEFDFFGWEIALVQHVGADLEVWAHNNKDYVVTDEGGTQLGDLSPKRQQALFAERLAVSKRLGLVSTSGVPRFVRRFQ